jgi:hypothetical protein
MYDKFLFIMDDMICITNIFLASMRVLFKISHSQKALLAYNPKTYMIWKFFVDGKYLVMTTRPLD